MSQAYPKYTAAEHLGVSHFEDPWLSWQINRRTMLWGRRVDQRLAERREERDTRPRRNYPTVFVPRYTYRQALGLDPTDIDMIDEPEVVDEARALLTGEVALEDWLKGA